jgi:hypothetical protein
MKKQGITIVIVLGVIAAVCVLLTGCQTREIVEYGPDGKTVVKITKSKDEWLTNKVLAGAGSVQAVKIEPAAGSTSSGTPLINATVGAANSATLDVPQSANKRVIAYSKSIGFLASIANAAAGGVSWTYISTENESAADTAKAISAMAKISTDVSTSTDTGTNSDSSTSSDSSVSE